MLAAGKGWGSVLNITSRNRPGRIQSLLIWTGLDGRPFKGLPVVGRWWGTAC